MRNSVLLSVRHGARSIVLSAALMGSTLGIASVAMVAPAFASISLTTEQTSSLQASLTAAIQAAAGNPAAIEAAISQAMQNAVAANGADAAASIASAILSIAEAAGATSAEIGTGLAQASAALSASNPLAASAIARTMANEGNADEIAFYRSTATALGYTDLASIAGEPPSPTGETGGQPNSGVAFGFSGNTSSGTTTNSGCLNPSCTSL